MVMVGVRRVLELGLGLAMVGVQRAPKLGLAMVVGVRRALKGPRLMRRRRLRRRQLLQMAGSKTWRGS